LLSDNVFTADALLYAVTLIFDPVVLTFDLWSWTFLVHRLWRDETLYQIWAKSNNSRRSYCDLNILTLWPWTRVTCLCSGINLTKSKLIQPIRSSKSFHRNVTLIFDDLTLNVCSKSNATCSNPVPNLSEMEQSQTELLTI